MLDFGRNTKAENAIELLKKRLAPKARVLRDGTWGEIPSRELVLGDIVPADVKLMKGDYLLLDDQRLLANHYVEKHISERLHESNRLGTSHIRMGLRVA